MDGHCILSQFREVLLELGFMHWEPIRVEWSTYKEHRDSSWICRRKKIEEIRIFNVDVQLNGKNVSSIWRLLLHLIFFCGIQWWVEEFKMLQFRLKNGIAAHWRWPYIIVGYALVWAVCRASQTYAKVWPIVYRWYWKEKLLSLEANGFRGMCYHHFPAFSKSIEQPARV